MQEGEPRIPLEQAGGKAALEPAALGPTPPASAGKGTAAPPHSLPAARGLSKVPRHSSLPAGGWGARGPQRWRRAAAGPRWHSCGGRGRRLNSPSGRTAGGS